MHVINNIFNDLLTYLMASTNFTIDINDQIIFVE